MVLPVKADFKVHFWVPEGNECLFADTEQTMLQCGPFPHLIVLEDKY